MLNSGKEIWLDATKTINILTLVLSEKKILKEKKIITPPPLCKLNGRSLNNRIGQQVIPNYIKSSPYKYAHELMTAKQNSNNRHLKF
jgi:hypothetical protein